MLRSFVFAFSFVVGFSVFADSIQSLELKDQFDVNTTINDSTQWMLFSAEKDASDLVNKSLEELKITNLKEWNGVYVADISKMPSIVTAMFALPKMKKYSFPVVLDREGEPTAKWPREKNKVTMMKLNKLEIVSAQFSNNVEEIKKFIQDQKTK